MMKRNVLHYQIENFIKELVFQQKENLFKNGKKEDKNILNKNVKSLKKKEKTLLDQYDQLNFFR